MGLVKVDSHPNLIWILKRKSIKIFFWREGNFFIVMVKILFANEIVKNLLGYIRSFTVKENHVVQRLARSFVTGKKAYYFNNRMKYDILHK